MNCRLQFARIGALCVGGMMFCDPGVLYNKDGAINGVKIDNTTYNAASVLLNTAFQKVSYYTTHDLDLLKAAAHKSCATNAKLTWHNIVDGAKSLCSKEKKRDAKRAMDALKAAYAEITSKDQLNLIDSVSEKTINLNKVLENFGKTYPDLKFEKMEEFQCQGFASAKWAATKDAAKDRFNEISSMSKISKVFFALITFIVFGGIASYILPESLSSHIPALVGLGAGWIWDLGKESALLGFGADVIRNATSFMFER